MGAQNGVARENPFIARHYQRLSAALALALAGDVDALRILAAALMDHMRPLLAEHLSSQGSALMNTEDVAAYLRTSVNAIHRLTGASAIPHAKLGGRCLFNKAEIDAWVAAHREGPPPSVSSPFPGLEKVP